MRKRLAEACLTSFCPRWIHDLIHFKGTGKRNDHENSAGESGTSYAKMLTKEMGHIDWTKDAVSIERLVRGLNLWPSAYTSYAGKTMKIWAAEVADLPGERARERSM